MPEDKIDPAASLEEALTERHRLMSAETFSSWGRGRLAYVRPVLSEDAKSLFPQAPEMQSGLQLYALFGADGTPLLLTDSVETARANAMACNMEALSIH